MGGARHAVQGGAEIMVFEGLGMQSGVDGAVVWAGHAVRVGGAEAMM